MAATENSQRRGQTPINQKAAAIAAEMAIAFHIPPLTDNSQSRSVQFFFTPARILTVRFGKNQSYFLLHNYKFHVEVLFVGIEFYKKIIECTQIHFWSFCDMFLRFANNNTFRPKQQHKRQLRR